MLSNIKSILKKNTNKEIKNSKNISFRNEIDFEYIPPYKIIYDNQYESHHKIYYRSQYIALPFHTRYIAIYNKSQIKNNNFSHSMKKTSFIRNINIKKQDHYEYKNKYKNKIINYIYNILYNIFL